MGFLTHSFYIVLTPYIFLHDSKDKANSINTKDGRKNYTALVNVHIPIFSNSSNSGNTYSQIAIADQSALKAKYTSENTLLEVKKECVVTWNTYLASNAMKKSSESAVESAEISSESNLEKISSGVESNSDAWVKENNLLESRINLANARKQEFVTGFRILAFTGELDMKYILDNTKWNNKASKSKP
jgi:outer membrane protein TolC